MAGEASPGLAPIDPWRPFAQRPTRLRVTARVFNLMRVR
jgi:hypothetical protein